MSHLLTRRKMTYKIVALAVIVTAWAYVMSEIYKYEMDAHYSLSPRRVEEIDSKHFLDKTTHLEVPEEHEVGQGVLITYDV